MISSLLGTSKPVLHSVAKLAMTRASRYPHVQSSAPIHSTPTNRKKSSDHEHKPFGQEPRFNPLGIEMLPDRLYKQVFGAEHLLSGEDDCLRSDLPSRYNLQRCVQHLKRHDLLPSQLTEIDTIYEYHKHLSKESCEGTQSQEVKTSSEDIVMDIPQLEGKNIDEHFRLLGKNYINNYMNLANELIDGASEIVHRMPSKWSNESGWTKYEPRDNCQGEYIATKVNQPSEDTVIFDVETCLSDSVQHAPTIAIALSSKAWYSWVSPRLHTDTHDNRMIEIKDLIPFKSDIVSEKLVIGHNVGFDRSFMRDQYELKESKTKFLDTLSLHMCICGLTGIQRAFKVAHKRKLKDNEAIDEQDLKNNAWIEKSCLNNLADVYEFHCGSTINKDERDIFVEGTMDDVRKNFQSLMTYCANDVKATFEVFKSLFPKFVERFPHPVTFAGMLEMSTMYLPVETKNWYKYIDNSQRKYDDFERQMSLALQDLANKACGHTEEDYAKDLWLWDLDWSKQFILPNKTKLKAWLKTKERLAASNPSIDQLVQQIYDTEAIMRQIKPFLAGFPKWYRDLCCPIAKKDALLGDKEWQPGPCLITTQMRVTPKLLQLTWDGYPLHFHLKHGWGYLVPKDDFVAECYEYPEDHPYRKFPLEQLRSFCKNLPKSFDIYEEDHSSELSPTEEDMIRTRIETLKDNTQIGTVNLMKLMKKFKSKKKIARKYKNELCDDVDIPGVFFIKLLHKNGPNYNVGNPLSRDFLSKMEDGTLSSRDDQLAQLLLKHSSALSYWKNNQKRIKNQMVVSLDKEDGPGPVGAILPRVIVAGTVTRRAVEPTWLTASNQDTTRIGSELKAMIQAPPGHCFVGADVDSQELWIASLMGDSYSYKIHGGTGLSYMTLRGSKSDSTDMHSKTASLIGISRSDAKVLNYARIYGAGRKFIERFLINTNQHLTPSEAKEKAKKIFQQTKGVRKFYSQKLSQSVDSFWDGGTESATFNKLEEIASSAEPKTPVLDCHISQALEPSLDQSKDFVTSRVNWVVQSSAVDFLHLVLVNMKWLFERLGIEGRFSISIHDEVRYLVKEEDKYKAAFALQVSNLLVRAYFAYKLNMKDLPISVAFFSSVDIDKCLRKEVNMDCQSPSNPQGLMTEYGISPGESLDVKQILKKYTYRVHK